MIPVSLRTLIVCLASLFPLLPLSGLAAPAGAAPAASAAPAAARAALAVVVALRGGEEIIGPGVVVAADRTVLTSQRLIDRSDEIHVFLPGARADFPDEDLIKYTRSQLDRGLRAKVLQADVPNDMALLLLPPRADESPAVTPVADLPQRRQEVLLVGAPEVGRFVTVSGQVAAAQKNTIEIDTRGNVATGGPLLDRDGRLLGYVTAWRKGAALARPASAVSRLLAATADKRRAHVASAPPPPPPPANEPNIDTVLRSLGGVFQKKLGRYQATRLYCEFLSARGQEGRSAVYSAGEVEGINVALAEQFKAAQNPAALEKQVGKALPALLVANDGHLWHREARRYALDFPALSWDVDDVQGTLYATNIARELLIYSKDGARFQPTGLVKVRDFQASNGTIFYVTMDGLLMQKGKSGTGRLLPRSVSIEGLVASQGILYMVEGGKLYRWGKGQWDRGGAPILDDARAVAAQGATWYALDKAGHVYSGAEARLIESENAMQSIWLIGKNVLALTRKGKVLGYTAATGRWQTLRE